MDFVAARMNMVDRQIRANGVQDAAVIRAMAEIPREAFLPKPQRGLAYVDETLDLGGGRWLMAPLALARLLQAGAITPTDVALVVGDSCGYVAAVTARLASFVVALDRDAETAQRAAPLLSDLAVGNVGLVHGPLAAGHRANAPYDVVVLAGAVGAIPAELGRQLGNGGRLVGVVAARPGLGKGTVMVRAGDTWGQRELFDANTPVLPGLEAAPGFVF